MAAIASVSAPSLVGRRRGQLRPVIFAVLLWACLVISSLFLLFVLITIAANGLARFDGTLFTAAPSTVRPETAGVRPAIIGTLWVIGLMILIAMPLGVAAAIYLEEYADSTRWYNRMIELNIQNLAAVPSIIFGILVLAFIVRNPGNLGPTVISAAIALALLIMPVIIIASREALRAVPREIRDGSLALGATQLQTITRQLLPAAIPGIATGSILAVSRAIGEAAPLLLVGAAAFVTFDPDGPLARYTVLPVQIYRFIGESREAFVPLAYAAILLLMIILLVMNGLAIFLRNRFQQRW